MSMMKQAFNLEFIIFLFDLWYQIYVTKKMLQDANKK